MSDVLDGKTHRSLEGAPSFPLRNRLERALWQSVWLLLGVWTPTPLHAWRRLLLTAFGAKIDASARVYPGVRVWLPRNLRMERRSTLGGGVDCYCIAAVTLGPYALVSQGAVLCTATHDVNDPDFQLVSAEINLASRSWVAAQAFVGPGVKVGEGAVLGARAVAFKDLSPWAIYVGNPAVMLRARGPF